jgi:hypothetical protein
VRAAFVDSFRVITLITACFAVVAALCAALLARSPAPPRCVHALATDESRCWARLPYPGRSSPAARQSCAPKLDNAFMRPVILVSGDLTIGDARAEEYRVTSDTGRFCQIAV